jgi:hypothetical protein
VGVCRSVHNAASGQSLSDVSSGFLDDMRYGDGGGVNQAARARRKQVRRQADRRHTGVDGRRGRRRQRSRRRMSAGFTSRAAAVPRSSTLISRAAPVGRRSRSVTMWLMRAASPWPSFRILGTRPALRTPPATATARQYRATYSRMGTASGSSFSSTPATNFIGGPWAPNMSAGSVTNS